MILLVLWCKFRHYDLGSKRQRRHAIFYGEGGRGVLDNRKIVIPLSNNIIYIFTLCPQSGSKTPISASYLEKFRESFVKTCEISKVEKSKRLLHSLFWGSGLRPDAVCKDPPTALRSDLENRLFARAECAVKSPM